LSTLIEVLGASQNTVRSAQALLAREGYLDIRHGSGVYVTERGVRKHVGIFTEFDITHPSIEKAGNLLLWHLRRLLEQQGVLHELYIGSAQPGQPPGEHSCWRFWNDIANRLLDGVVALSPADAVHMPVLQNARPAVVGTCFQFPHAIGVDHMQMVRDGVRALHEQGCRRPALMIWNDRADIDVFKEAVAELGMPFEPLWVRNEIEPLQTAAGWQELRDIWLARREKPDGLLVGDDVLFRDAQLAIAELGIRVPDQLRVVAAANRGSGIKPIIPVTLFEVDLEEQARALVDILRRLMNGEQVAPCHDVVPYRRVPSLRGPGGFPVEPPAGNMETDPRECESIEAVACERQSREGEQR
jgi:hypothetical protein